MPQNGQKNRIRHLESGKGRCIRDQGGRRKKQQRSNVPTEDRMYFEKTGLDSSTPLRPIQ